MKKSNNGITLISLVITIVIMLILASVSISFIIGNNGLFKKSSSGAQLYKNKADKESSMLDNLANSIDDDDSNKSIETPILTQNSDKVICSSEQTHWEAWRVFDDIYDKDNAWFANSLSNAYVGYDFTNSIQVTRIELINNTYNSSNSDYRVNQIQVIGSNDNSNFTPLTDIINIKQDLSVQEFNINTTDKYRYIAVRCISTEGRNVSLQELKIYSNSNNHIVQLNRTPILTGPSDKLTFSDEQASYPAWKMFDDKININDAWYTNFSPTAYFTYNFDTPISLKKICLVNGYWNSTDNYRVKTITLYGSNDNSNWTQIGQIIPLEQKSNIQTFNISTNTKYQYIKVFCTNNYTQKYPISLQEFIFYFK